MEGKIDKYDMESLWFNDFAGTPERCWFAAGNINGLFAANLVTGEAIFLKRFSKAKEWRKCLYECCVKYANKILFAPGLADNIAIYDVEEDELIEIPLVSNMLIPDVKVISIVQYDNFCFLIGNITPVIICVNLLNNDISYDYNIFDVKEFADELIMDGYWWDKDIIKKENSFIVVSHKLCIYLEYDIKTRNAELHRLNTYLFESGVYALNADMYAYSYGKEKIFIVKNKNKNEFLIKEEICQKFQKFVCSHLTNDTYYIFTDANVIIKIDLSINEIEYFNVDEYQIPFIIEGKLFEFFRCIKIINNEMYLLQAGGNYMKKYDLQCRELFRTRVIPYNKSMLDLGSAKYYLENIVMETVSNPFSDCESLVKLIPQMCDKSNRKDANDNIGKKIYSYL
ncbi:MAG: hypothetical protein HFH75_11395 [Lachnospiraceae bacterium]|jgi:hypothetical protein|nr:hypothetical protein [Lachnospiraceae bacterium]